MKINFLKQEKSSYSSPYPFNTYSSPDPFNSGKIYDNDIFLSLPNCIWECVGLFYPLKLTIWWVYAPKYNLGASENY